MLFFPQSFFVTKPKLDNLFLSKVFLKVYVCRCAKLRLDS